MNEYHQQRIIRAIHDVGIEYEYCKHFDDEIFDFSNSLSYVQERRLAIWLEGLGYELVPHANGAHRSRYYLIRIKEVLPLIVSTLNV